MPFFGSNNKLIILLQVLIRNTGLLLYTLKSSLKKFQDLHVNVSHMNILFNLEMMNEESKDARFC